MICVQDKKLWVARNCAARAKINPDRWDRAQAREIRYCHPAGDPSFIPGTVNKQLKKKVFFPVNGSGTGKKIRSQTATNARQDMFF